MAAHHKIPRSLRFAIDTPIPSATVKSSVVAFGCDVTGHNLTVIGNGNVVYGNRNYVEGHHNTVYGQHCRVIGTDNVHVQWQTQTKRPSEQTAKARKSKNRLLYVDENGVPRREQGMYGIMCDYASPSCGITRFAVSERHNQVVFPLHMPSEFTALPSKKEVEGARVKPDFEVLPAEKRA